MSPPIRIVLDGAPLLARLEEAAPADGGEVVEWQAFAFEFTRPTVDDAGRPRITVEIDNVSSEILRYAQLAAASADLLEITYREYLEGGTDQGPENTPVHLAVVSVRATVFSVTLDAVLAGFSADQPFPSEVYTVERFPGLVG